MVRTGDPVPSTRTNTSFDTAHSESRMPNIIRVPISTQRLPIQGRHRILSMVHGFPIK